MKITIDPGSGFCFGVQNAIETAEDLLSKNQKLYSLGEIVHNGEEIERLEKMGMVTIGHNELPTAGDAAILLRAHGEPPETYRIAKENGLNIIDATCPIVSRLQSKVKKAFHEMNEKGGRVAIFGNKKHPEAIGLAGQTANTAIIIESFDDIDKIDISKPLRLFAQTTKNLFEYEEIVNTLKKKYKEKGKERDFVHYNTVCKLVSGRGERLKDFCKNNDVVIFVSGRNSSNGKYLFGICKSANKSSYKISSPVELKLEWFEKAKSVGISGATSTPKWLMEKVANTIAGIHFQ